MGLVYLYGDPVGHSLSPAMHNAAFAALRLPHRYEAKAVAAADLALAVERLRGDDVLGANVTVPHKERVVRHLDEVADNARRIGAVNTVVRRGAKLIGDNTDLPGFTGALAERGVATSGTRALVLGAGGGARACVLALVRGGASVSVANRTAERAARLAADLGVGERVRAAGWPTGADLGGYDLVVQATSLGLRAEDPLAGVPLPASLTVIDIVPTSAETPLHARAREAGCVVVDGLLMLLHQAAGSFTLWTGLPAPVDAMRAALPRRV